MERPPEFPPGPPRFIGPPDPPAPAPAPLPLTGRASEPPIKQTLPGLGDREPPPPSAAAAVLRNPLIVAGMAIVIVLLLIAIVLVVIGGGDDPARSVTTNGSRPTPDSTEAASFRVRGLLGRALETTTVRAGPDDRYAVLGLLRKGAPVDVVGRNEDATWLQAYYPPGSQLRGWIEADAVEVDGDVAGLAIGQPDLGPSVPEPVEEPAEEEVDEPVEVPTEPLEPTEPPLPTDTPPPLPTDTPPPPPPTDTPGVPPPTPGGPGM